MIPVLKLSEHLQERDLRRLIDRAERRLAVARTLQKRERFARRIRTAKGQLLALKLSEL